MIHMPIAKVWALILRDRTLSKQCTEKMCEVSYPFGKRFRRC